MKPKSGSDGGLRHMEGSQSYRTRHMSLLDVASAFFGLWLLATGYPSRARSTAPSGSVDSLDIGGPGREVGLRMRVRKATVISDCCSALATA